MAAIARAEILRKFHDMVARGQPIVGGGAGTGISAKAEEAGGIDLIIIYNSGRYRMAGRGSAAGLLAYGNANEIVKDMAREVLPVVKRTPVLAGGERHRPVRADAAVPRRTQSHPHPVPPPQGGRRPKHWRWCERLPPPCGEGTGVGVLFPHRREQMVETPEGGAGWWHKVGPGCTVFVPEDRFPLDAQYPAAGRCSFSSSIRRPDPSWGCAICRISAHPKAEWKLRFHFQVTTPRFTL
jgi:hypothetical protein